MPDGYKSIANCFWRIIVGTSIFAILICNKFLAILICGKFLTLLIKNSAIDAKIATKTKDEGTINFLNLLLIVT